MAAASRRHERDTAVLSNRAWRGKFNADPGILGRKMVLDGRLYTVVGVLPSDHRSVVGFGISPDVYLPVSHTDEAVQLYARMPRGMTIAVARARLRTVFDQLDRLHPSDAGKRTSRTRVMGVTGFDILNQLMPGAVTAFFAMLMILVGLVLLIACTNVASLLLARASSRSHEFAIRLSLGASRRRIVRHLLAESLLISVLGSFAGLMINLACAKWLNNLTLPVPAPVHFVILPDWRLLSYSLCLVLACVLLCGLLPALRAARNGVSHALKQEEHQTARAWNLRSALVAGQLAVSIVLLSAASLFIHNLLRATSMDPGFDVRHTVWAYMRLVPDRYNDANQTKQMALTHLALERLRTLPGVESVAIAQRVPLNGNCVIGALVRTDLSPGGIHVEFQCNNVGPDYFHALGIPLLRGREFTVADRKGSQPTVIVNESFARAVFGNRNPIGHRITLDLPNEKSKLIVGIAKDSKYFTLNERQRLAVYEPYFASSEPADLQFLIRTPDSPVRYVQPVTDLLASFDPTAAIETKPMSRALGLALLPSRAAAAMFGAMGILGLLLAAIGLYGVLLYSVSRRTREIGVRMALGAAPSDVFHLIGRYSLLLIGSGAFSGLALSFLAMQPLALFLVPGMNTLDPATFLTVIGVLAVVALLAILAPAVRAMRIDPMTALRYE